MISTTDLGMAFGGQRLFDNVNVKFVPDECYGLIGANGAGKSTFLKILSGDIESTEGNVNIDPNLRISVLKQDHFAFEDSKVMDTVLMGDNALYEIYAERMTLYAKDELSDAEGERVGDLEEAFSDMDGYTAEAKAASMLNELGIDNDLHDKKMSELEAHEKVKVLLAQSLFGNPDILLLDEPTNQLDYLAVLWLEEFIKNFKNTVIVVSHDRHFLNNVCTYIADVDFGEIKLYPGNYEFWRSASELAMKQRQDKNKKNEKKVQELQDFVRRFSANASKSKQATSRKKLIEELQPETLPISKRRTPFIQFKPKRPCGTSVLRVENVSHSVDGDALLSNVSFTVEKNDKIAVLGKNSLSKTILLDIISGTCIPDSGSISWGETISTSYYPKDNTDYFKSPQPLNQWLQEYQEGSDIDELYGFLGRMLFSGEEAKKNIDVLSGGEKARALFSKMMLEGSNFLLFDEPTDHLDLESISSLNTALDHFQGGLMFATHDYEILNSVPNRLIEVGPNGMIDRRSSFDDYMRNEDVADIRSKIN